MNEKLGFWKLGTFGLQHVLAMYGGAVVVPLIVGPAIGLNEAEVAYLISIDLGIIKKITSQYAHKFE